MRDAHRWVQKPFYSTSHAREARQRLALSAMAMLLLACAWGQIKLSIKATRRKPQEAQVWVPPLTHLTPPLRHTATKPLPLPKNAQAPHSPETPVKPHSPPRPHAAPNLKWPQGPPAAGEYSLQVNAYAQAAEAEAFCALLRRKGYAPYIIQAENGAWHKVRLGRFTHARAARDAQAALARKDLPAWVVSPQS
jgi:cell division septation protein DedD